MFFFLNKRNTISKPEKKFLNIFKFPWSFCMLARTPVLQSSRFQSILMDCFGHFVGWSCWKATVASHHFPWGLTYCPSFCSTRHFKCTKIIAPFYYFFFLFLKFIYFNWKRITLQYCSGFTIEIWWAVKSTDEKKIKENKMLMKEKNLSPRKDKRLKGQRG